MSGTQYDYLFKFILVGDSGVGKSSLLLRFMQNIFSNKFQATIGVSYQTSMMEVQNKTVKLQIWDTAGQEAFKSITRSYYKAAIGVLLVYDVSRKETFNNIKNWVKQIQKYSHQHISIAILGNKNDVKKNQRQVQQAQAKQFVDDNKFIGHYLVSALNGENIKQPFIKLTQSILHKINDKIINLEVDEYSGIKIGNKSSSKGTTSVSIKNTPRRYSYC